MTQRLWIPGRLPGANEIIKAAKSGRGKTGGYSRMKIPLTEMIAGLAIRAGLKRVARAKFRFVWKEPSRRRDPDNIIAGAKFVFDGLVAADVLFDDGWDEVTAVAHFWIVSDEPGVEVFITDEDDDE